MSEKLLLRALAGETHAVPPVWMMRQAGRYLPEYRETRAKAGDFLSLCYNPELACEVTLQPIRRYGFDAAILFADILLLPQALGADLWFETGEGPRLSTISGPADMARLKSADAIHDHLAPVYEAAGLIASSLPRQTAFIGFAGAPWTVATYMIAGRGTPDQAPAHRLMRTDPDTFDRLIDLLTEATTAYLLKQIEAGAEVIKLFDSWAGSLRGAAFGKYAIAPVARIIKGLKAAHPNVPVIAFPREAGVRFEGFARATGADCVALDTAVNASWATEHVQRDGCVQGNLDPRLLVTGGEALAREARRVKEAFASGPHIFNLGHGITPDADPANVETMLNAIRS
ncbi:MAG: uroporphyrinogen decarboxylase [Paracoccaceae bacterium]